MVLLIRDGELIDPLWSKLLRADALILKIPGEAHTK